MIKCGIDLVLNKRIKENLKSLDFLKKVFHASELKDEKKLAGIFSLKEAMMKAIGKKLSWSDIEVSTREGKKPKISVSGRKFKSIDCSVSHDGDYTIGMVVVEI